MKLRSFLFSAIIGSALFFSLGFAVLQTKWGKEKLKHWMIEAAAKEGIFISMDTLEGKLPFKWIIAKLQVQDDEGNILELERCKARIAFFPLLRKQFVISHLHVSKAVYSFVPSSSGNWKAPETLPSLNIGIKHLKIASFSIENQATQESLSFSVEGRGRLRKDRRALFLDLRLAFAHSPTDYIQLLVSSDQKREDLSVAIKSQLQSTNLLSPLVKLPFEIDFHFRLHLTGPWNTWEAIAKGIPSSSFPLSGKLQSEILRLDLPQIKEIDRRWKIEAACSWRPDRSLDFESFSAESDIGWIQGSGSLDPQGTVTTTEAKFAVPELSLFNPYFPTPIDGSLEGKACYNEKKASLSLRANEILLAGQIIPSASLESYGVNEAGIWKGNFSCSLEHTILPLKGLGNFAWEKEKEISFTDLHIAGPDTELEGYVNYELANKRFNGSLSLQLLDLSLARSWLPRAGLDGKVDIEIGLNSGENQRLMLLATLSQVHAYRAFVDRASLSLDIADLFHQPTGSASLEIQKGAYKDATFSLFSLGAQSSEKGNWVYHLNTDGFWRDPWSASLSGKWNLEDKISTLSVEDLTASLLNQAFKLEKPFVITQTDSSLKISDALFSLEQGKCVFGCDLSLAQSNGFLKAEHFPLDLFFFSFPGLALNGTTSIEGSFAATPENLTGRLVLFLEPTDIYQFGKEDPIKARGSVQANVNHGVLQLHASLLATADQLFDWSASLPVTHTSYPLKFSLDPNKPFASELTIEGKLEEIFDFVNLGSHKLKGDVICHLLFSQTPAEPAINGSIEIAHGTYENYFTGTTIKNLDAHLEAQKTEMKIVSLSGNDGKEGTVKASGTIALSPQKKFPYMIEAELDHLNAVRFDMISSDLTGLLRISGTTEGALAQGALSVPHTLFRIPEELPIDIPILPITFINQPYHLEEHELNLTPLFPFHLNLNLHAENNVFVTGRGLTAELSGDLHVTGTNTAILADGSLTLIKGKYEFAGKNFTLTEGEISFSDQPNHKTHLNLRGSLSLQDKTIIAVLSGPLASPILTFQSLPPLPTSSILSLILFNKDITEIHRIEAIQLAQTLMSLSGGAGPGIIEKIRKSLGVDRLTIVSNPNNQDEISLQIGKYLTRGVMVTLNQGTTSSQIVIEVELKHGFVLQAENQQEDDEQGGKFSLKWNKNY